MIFFVLDSPRLVPQMSSKDIAVRENDPVNLRCQFIGSPTPNITWYRSVKNDRNQAQESKQICCLFRPVNASLKRKNCSINAILR